MRRSEQPLWLTQTKLQPPRLRQDLVARHRLRDDLAAAVTSHRLTLLSAPAGYGKTTLLAGLAQAAPELPLAWLSLDEEDNDPGRFLSALIVTLQRLNPSCGLTAQNVLAGLDNPAAEIRRVVGVLINDILETVPDPFGLVLDDLHAISEPTVYKALDYLLDHLPPQMHVVVGTRHDPPLALARLRSREELAEFRLAELRFTLTETTAFLNEQLRLGLSADDLTTLYHRTDGWAAGLRLLAGSLQGRFPFGERSDFIAHLAQSHRYIFDLLAEEVLQQQEESVQTFLLETSILTELTPTLCQAVTGRPDSAAMLEKLYHRNLFLVAMELRDQDTSQQRPNESGKTSLFTQSSNFPIFQSPVSEATLPISPSPTYRYHDLFADFLRQQLAREMPERLPDLHRRAAEAHSIPTRAIRHYLAAGLWAEAAQTIAEVGDQLLQQGLLTSLQGWIETLPAAVRRA
ncbi:MAG: hypothetical protein R3264_09420, partial [Anaerolineae bacterium]|nr:hypothetical protein [Anaerolineae bacterium]